MDEPQYRISHWAPEKSGTALVTVPGAGGRNRQPPARQLISSVLIGQVVRPRRVRPARQAGCLESLRQFASRCV
jgi:hypothetical protein